MKNLWKVPTVAILACLIGLAPSRGELSRRADGIDQTSSAISTASIISFIDVHSHLEPADFSHSMDAALEAMHHEKAEKIIVMPPPFTSGDPGRYDADLILTKLARHSDEIKVLGGGGTLNAMIHESVQSGDSGSMVRKRFKGEAEKLLAAGVFGFGEMAAEHFQGGTAYQSAPPDHPLFLLLADIAAEHAVPIDLHMEAVLKDMDLPGGLKSRPNPARLHSNIAAFERLLTHNPRAKIIWAHAGTDNTGDRTPALCRRLLSEHRNLYMELKIDPANLGKNSLLENGTSGPIKADWLKLFEDFPDRFLVGTDQHYPEPPANTQRWQAMVVLLNQLPAPLRQQIGQDNAFSLYAPHQRAQNTH